MTQPTPELGGLRALVTSDWHLDAVTAGYSREADLRRAVDWVVAQAIALKVQLVLHLGDLCDPDPNRAPRCAAVAINAARRLHQEGIASRWLVGNHDVIEDGSGTSTLEPLREAGGQLGARVWASPTTELFQGVHLVALPYTPRCEHYDAADVLDTMLHHVPDGEPLVVCGHLSVEGADLGSESHEMARGRAMAFPHHGALRRALCLNGHYHKTQLVGEGSLVFVPGALERLTFGERDNEPGVLLLQVAGTAAERRTPKGAMSLPGTPQGVKLWRIPRPAADVRALVDITDADTAWQTANLSGKEAGAIVRLQPPADATDDQVGALLEQVRRVAASAKLLPRPHQRAVTAAAQVAAVAPAGAPPEPVRSVVERLAREVATPDQAALQTLLNDLLTEAGL